MASEAAPVDFSGRWTLTKNENFDEYSAAVGMPWMARKMGAKSSPEMEVTQTSNHFKVVLKTMMFTNEQEFKVGEEFIFEPPRSGQRLKSLAKWEGDKLVVNGEPESPGQTNVISMQTIRELNGKDETILTMAVKCKDNPEKEITMRRFFSRIV